MDTIFTNSEHIQDYFDYIFKKTWGKTVNPSIRIYINKIENRITYKIKKEYWISWSFDSWNNEIIWKHWK